CILLTSRIRQMLFAATLGVLYALGRLGIVPILLIAFFTGLAQSQSAPTYQAVLTSLVPPKQIPNAVALNSLQFNLSRAIGPVIAGIILAKWGTGPCFAVNALSFLAVIIALWRIDLPPPAPTTGETLGESLRVGLRHVWQSQVLSVLTALGLTGSLLAFNLMTYLPVMEVAWLQTGGSDCSFLSYI